MTVIITLGSIICLLAIWRAEKIDIKRLEAEREMWRKDYELQKEMLEQCKFTAGCYKELYNITQKKA